MPARVYFGELGKMINKYENDWDIRGYLDGLNVFVYLLPAIPLDETTLRRLTGWRANSEVSESANGSLLTRPHEKGPEATITALSV